MVLDPKRYWCVRSLDLDLKTLVAVGKHRTQTELADPTASLPLPNRHVENQDFNMLKTQQPYRLSSELVYSLSQRADLPGDEEFTLTAFVLPEPPGVTWPKPTPWYLWLALAGGLCLALGGVFHWLKKRSAAAALTP